MRHADKTVTIYRKTWDSEQGIDVYTGTVFTNVSFFSRIATAVSTEGLAAACEGVLRIPAVAIPEGWELHNGDLCCEGMLPTMRKHPADLDDLCPHVFTVVGITWNTDGRSPHLKAVCK